jgi:hypothetical protein
MAKNAPRSSRSRSSRTTAADADAAAGAGAGAGDGDGDGDDTCPTASTEARVFWCNHQTTAAAQARRLVCFGLPSTAEHRAAMPPFNRGGPDAPPVPPEIRCYDVPVYGVKIREAGMCMCVVCVCVCVCVASCSAAWVPRERLAIPRFLNSPHLHTTAHYHCTWQILSFAVPIAVRPARAHS